MFHPSSLRFAVNPRLRRAKRILPVFLPFAGCPQRCVFCAQDRQSGAQSASAGLREAERRLAALPRPPEPPGSPAWELAFYGGTFTALPPDVLEPCLALLARHRAALSHARCSTRPDALNPAILARLRAGGIDLVEVGVQSFHSGALALARRGYDGERALAGCRAVAEAGLALGIQLLPGMPGVTPEIFLADARAALDLRPACLRFYPCLVPEGTELAALWRAGRYAPWSLETTVATLGEALALAWEANVPVIRLAVAPEEGFDAALLAGPRHPALGSLIQAEALRRAVEQRLPALGRPPAGLTLPASCQGYLYGEKNALKLWWTAHGLPPERIRFHPPRHADHDAILE